MFAAYVLESPFYIFYYTVFLLSFLFDLVLFYVICQHTSPKMKNIKPIIQTLMIIQIWAELSLAMGSAPEYVYPLPIIRYNGYFTLIGPDYGGIVGVTVVIQSISLGGLCIMQCCLYRYLVLFYSFKYTLQFSRYFPLHLILAIIVLAGGVYFNKNYAFMNVTRYLNYLTANNIRYNDVNVDFKQDTLTIVNTNREENMWMVYLFFGAMALCEFLVYALSISMYRRLSAHVSLTSTLTSNQQKRITIMLLGQATLPVLFLAISSVAIFLAYTSSDDSPPMICWQLLMAALVLYPPSSSILVCTLTTPYYLFFKRRFLQILPGKRKTRENSTSMVLK